MNNQLNPQLQGIVNLINKQAGQRRPASVELAPVQAKPVAAPVKQKNEAGSRKTKKKNNSMAQITKLVNKHNALIDLNNQKGQKYDIDDYGDKNSPQFLDPSDTFGISEEEQYLKNRIYKLNGDERYVPDHEELKKMNDEEYMEFIGDIGMAKDENSTDRVYRASDQTDNLSDEQFTNALDKSINQSMRKSNY